MYLWVNQANPSIATKVASDSTIFSNIVITEGMYILSTLKVTKLFPSLYWYLRRTRAMIKPPTTPGAIQATKGGKKSWLFTTKNAVTVAI